MQRFLWLDAARGIAAIAVMAYHFMPLSGLSSGLFKSAYLAVDLFFIMSGFVLAHAYEAKLLSGRMDSLRYLGVRLIRLYPVYLVGMAIGGGYYLIKIVLGTPDAPSPGDWIALTAINAFFVPNPEWITEPAGIFPFAPSTWSLSTEMIVSIIYGSVLYRPSFRWLVVAFALTTAAFVAAALSIGNMDLGWGWPNFGYGVLRTLSLFSFGVLLFRCRDRGFRPSNLLAGVLLVATTLMLVVVPKQHTVMNLLIAYSLFPLFVHADPGQHVGWLDRISSELGRFSYPIYVVHTPVALMILGTAKVLHIDYQRHSALLMFVLVVSVIAVSYIILRYFDEPVRQALSRRMKRRTPVDIVLAEGLSDNARR